MLAFLKMTKYSLALLSVAGVKAWLFYNVNDEIALCWPALMGFYSRLNDCPTLFISLMTFSLFWKQLLNYLVSNISPLVLLKLLDLSWFCADVNRRLAGHTAMTYTDQYVPKQGSQEYNEQMNKWDEDRRLQQYVGIAITTSAATVAVIIRLYAQRAYRKGWGLDDAFILVALVWAICISILCKLMS